MDSTGKGNNGNNGNGNGNNGNGNNGNGSNPDTTSTTKPGKYENLQFFYHPDHLGSSNYITDASGEVYQHNEYFPYGETFVEERNAAEYTNYLFSGKELDEETGLYYFGARYQDPKTSQFINLDPKMDKYPNISGYSYCLNNPINAVDPDGRDVILLIWASHDGKIGHAGVATSNYKQVSERVKVSGKWTTQTKMVPDGTYTYRDLWPKDAVGKENYDKNVQAAYQNKKVTLDQLLNTDVTGSEGYTADGVIQFSTGHKNDVKVQTELDNFQKSNPSYNGLSINCSDFVEAALEAMTGTQLPVDEKLTSKKSATTPNQTYKAANSLSNPKKILKDPGSKINTGFLQAVSGGGKRLKIAEKTLD